MNTRNVATVLWFLAGWSAFGLVFGLMSLPSWFALVGGLGTAALIRWDPSGQLWAKKAPARRVRPIEELARELDQRSAEGLGTTGERTVA